VNKGLLSVIRGFVLNVVFSSALIKRLARVDYHEVFSITGMCKRDRCKVPLVLTFLVSASGLKEIFSLFFHRELNKHFVITMIFCIVSLLGPDLNDLRQKYIKPSPRGETYKKGSTIMKSQHRPLLWLTARIGG